MPQSYAEGGIPLLLTELMREVLGFSYEEIIWKQRFKIGRDFISSAKCLSYRHTLLRYLKIAADNKLRPLPW